MANEAAALRNAASLLAHRSVELWQLSVYSSPFLAAKTDKLRREKRLLCSPRLCCQQAQMLPLAPAHPAAVLAPA